MAADIDEQLVTHKIDAYLYPFHLPGKYMARTRTGPLLRGVCIQRERGVQGEP
jgi:hypothetical protein